MEERKEKRRGRKTTTEDNKREKEIGMADKWMIMMKKRRKNELESEFIFNFGMRE